MTNSKVTTTSLKTNLCICPICDDPIEEQSETTPGHDAIHCDGICDSWLHRRCAGLSKSDSKFLCPHCHLHDLISEVTSLKSIVSNLTAELSSIKSQLVSSDHQIGTPGLIPSATSLSTTTSSPSSSNKPYASSSNKPYELDKKFNVVVYGIKEHPMGTSKSKRQQEDLQQVINVFFKIDKSVLP